MKKRKIILRVLSIIFIILATVDIVNIIMELVNGEFRDIVESTFFDKNATISEGVKNAVFYCSIVGSLVMESLILYLGVKGFNQSRGKIKGTGNIILAKVMIVLLIVSILAVVPQLINGQITPISFASNFISVIFVYCYIRFAKLVTKEGKTE